MSEGFDAPLTHEAPSAAIFHDLNSEQANGLMCVVATCREDFTTSLVNHVPVGVSATTGSQVFACTHRCAATVGYRPPAGEQLDLESGR